MITIISIFSILVFLLRLTLFSILSHDIIRISLILLQEMEIFSYRVSLFTWSLYSIGMSCNSCSRKFRQGIEPATSDLVVLVAILLSFTVRQSIKYVFVYNLLRVVYTFAVN